MSGRTIRDIAVRLTSSDVQRILEMSRFHDQELKDVRLDVVRAETRLLTEQGWRWVDRIGCSIISCLVLFVCLQPGAVRDALEGLGSAAWTVTPELFVENPPQGGAFLESGDADLGVVPHVRGPPRHNNHFS